MNFHRDENYSHCFMPKVHVLLGFEESVNALVTADEAFDSKLAALNASLIQAMVDIIDLDERLSQMEINGIEYDIQDNCGGNILTNKS